MRLGILGSGLMGAKLGTLFARAGHEVDFSYATLAVHWSWIDDVLRQAGDLSGKVAAS
jgi:8-hydroxy-5-deazaflavin:NADPH oxidoreductase